MNTGTPLLDRPWVSRSVFGVACALFLVSLFARIGTPLIWNDEAETAMYGTRILRYGYPKVNDGKNNLYVYDGPTQMRAYDARHDANVYFGWVQFYFAAPGAWVAQHFSDPNVRTAIMRVPYALAGTLALTLFILIITKWFRRRLLVASAFIVLSGLCIPLVLHMREVRYYSLALLCLAGVTWLYTQHCVHARLTYRKYFWGMCSLLVLTFTTFHPLFFICIATLGIFALVKAQQGWPVALRAFAPLVIAFVAVMPIAKYFRTFQLTQDLNHRYGFGLNDYLRNIWVILNDLTKSSFLVPVIIIAVLCILLYRDAAPHVRQRVKLQLHTFVFLATLVVITLAAISSTVIIFQRYYLYIMPLLTCMFMLSVASCSTLLTLHEGTERMQQVKTWFMRGLIVTAAIPLLLSARNITGHVREIITPYKGTVDYTVSYIREHYPDPSKLVIATNYEEQSLMFYLGSRVTVGQVLNNLAEDLTYQPDVIIPRASSMTRSLPYLEELRRKAIYRMVTFPIADYKVNNIPDLSHPSINHQFTRLPVGEEGPMVIYVRTDGETSP